MFDQPPPPGRPTGAVVCAWCKAHLGGPRIAPHIPVSHGICVPCGTRILTEWGMTLDPGGQGTAAQITIKVATDPDDADSGSGPQHDPWVDLGGEG